MLNTIFQEDSTLLSDEVIKDATLVFLVAEGSSRTFKASSK
jgi:hypothetical protein